MKLHYLRLTAWAPLLLLVWTAAVGAGAGNDLAQLRERLDTMHSLEGDFTQTLFDADGTLLEESRGNFALQRPGKFYWHTRAPFEQLLVSDGETIWLYDPDLAQVTRRSYDEQVQGSPALILSEDIDRLGQNFQVRRRDLDGESDSFVLEPRNDEGLFQTLELVFAGERLAEIRMRDNLDQLTIFELSNVERNVSIDPQRFMFEPPEGVDVLVD